MAACDAVADNIGRYASRPEIHSAIKVVLPLIWRWTTSWEQAKYDAKKAYVFRHLGHWVGVFIKSGAGYRRRGERIPERLYRLHGGRRSAIKNDRKSVLPVSGK